MQSELVEIAYAETLGMEMNSVDSQILQKKQRLSSQGKSTFDVEDQNLIKKIKHARKENNTLQRRIVEGQQE